MSQMKLDHDTLNAVQVAVALVNSHDPVAAVDELVSPEDLGRIVRAGAYVKPQPITDAVLADVRPLRQRLRSVFGMDEADAVDALDDLVAESGAMPRLVRHDGSGWHFHFTAPETSWADALAADLAMGLLFVIRDFGFARLGECAAETCGKVFVDLSRNASKRYCDPKTCGNRAAVAAYRARQGE
jgi:predicted RNA-binding Zn ribbon-like protein